MTYNEIKKILNEVINEINEILPANNPLTPQDSELLYGKNSKLDSVALVNFILILEEKIQIEYNYNINIFDFFSKNENYDITINQLIEFILNE
tara:strand:+ start:137 stop:415 length:279 start_codon:yes stop_codon:yes gene_type:complete